MARLLSQTLIKTSSSSFSNPLKLITPSSLNQFSTRSSSSSSSLKKPKSTDESKSEIDVDVLALKKLDDFVHNVIVKQCEPDWLPFVPGMSYWVPPRRDVSKEVFDVFKTLTNPLTVGGCLDESMAVVMARAWPSSDFFIQGTSPMRPVDVNVDESDDNVSQPEDKEG
ncbi:hypothetical protein CTI12_AA272200 [Artemisia annua]|uniref:Uncharacterized protein n=1 Tax=Artemisia annua TaxID=35608 RepID=A0A2U1M1L4_ARTAN|nr:hypothetical protein CTI12_AA272200 [Artemisia annua]